ncbi:hypothetical protein RFI_08461 [Reticulomyxa filosa]|uniref:Uncharacterized protein n=1 Tax=Reticulomyxa filosa TaxID=46433 RepID=X6NRV7_RETFI|nr:hypothetical protein RFI_08461 [Reticulomyxa filosa]|eukprot:ETO28673.1 hypothetical protein RFI_08461 [Reticulomyxa filosa]
MAWRTANQLYEGDWKNDVPHGQGKYYFGNDGVNVIEGNSINISKRLIDWYEGEFLNGVRSGYGVYHYANGAKYSGHWLNNKKHGQGEFIREDGYKFIGEFAMDEPVLLEYPPVSLDAEIINAPMFAPPAILDLYQHLSNNQKIIISKEIDKLLIIHGRLLRSIYDKYRASLSLLTLHQFDMLLKCSQCESVQLTFYTIHKIIFQSVFLRENDIQMLPTSSSLQCSDSNNFYLSYSQFVESLIRIARDNTIDLDSKLSFLLQNKLSRFALSTSLSTDSVECQWSEMNTEYSALWEEDAKVLLDEMYESLDRQYWSQNEKITNTFECNYTTIAFVLQKCKERADSTKTDWLPFFNTLSITHRIIEVIEQMYDFKNLMLENSYQPNINKQKQARNNQSAGSKSSKLSTESSLPPHTSVVKDKPLTEIEHPNSNDRVSSEITSQQFLTNIIKIICVTLCIVKKGFNQKQQQIAETELQIQKLNQTSLKKPPKTKQMEHKKDEVAQEISNYQQQLQQLKQDITDGIFEKSSIFKFDNRNKIKIYFFKLLLLSTLDVQVFADFEHRLTL